MLFQTNSIWRVVSGTPVKESTGEPLECTSECLTLSLPTCSPLLCYRQSLLPQFSLLPNKNCHNLHMHSLSLPFQPFHKTLFLVLWPNYNLLFYAGNHYMCFHCVLFPVPCPSFPLQNLRIQTRI